jgi:Tfp pilus assembly protein PilF
LRRNPRSLRGWLAAVALSAQLSLLLSACHNPYKEGLTALQAGDLDLAEREARAGLQEDPRDPELNLLLGQVLVRREAWAEARVPAARAVRGLADRPSAHLLHARVQEELGATIEAAEHYLLARRLDPGALKGFEERLLRLLPRAITAARDNDLPERAIDFMLLLRALDPQAPAAAEAPLREAREARGRKLTRRGAWSEAADWYAELTRLYPDEPSFLLERGVLLLALERDQEADAPLQAWLSQDPAQKPARLEALGERALIRGRARAAEGFWEEAAALEPSRRSVQLALAALRYQEGRDEDAWGSLRAALAGSPSPDDYLKAAQVATDQRRGEVAVEVLREGLDKATPDFGLTRQLAQLLQSRQRAGEVEATFQAYLERVGQGEARVNAALDIAAWLEGQRDLEGAARYVELALATPGAPGRAWLQLANLQAARGRRSEMVTALARYVEGSEKAPNDYNTAAGLLIDKNLFEEAERVLLDGLKRHKDDDGLTRQLAQAYARGGFPEREVALWREWIKRQPDPAGASLEVGRRYLERTAYREAISFLEGALKDPRHATQGWLLTGQAWMERGQDREARAAFERYLASAPDRDAALPILLSLYSRNNDVPAAIAILEEIITRKPQENERRHELAALYKRLGDNDKAIEQLEIFIKNADRPAQAARRAGRVFVDDPGRAVALRLYDVLLRHHGQDPSIYAEVGDLYWEASRLPELSAERKRQLEDTARGHYARFIAGYAPPAEDRERALTSLPDRLNERGLWRLSLEAFARAAELKIALTATEELERGIAHLRQGQQEEARAAFGAHLRLSQDKGPQYFKLGELAMEAGAYKMALEYLREVLDRDVQAYVTRAFELSSRALVATGRKKEIPPLAVRTLELTRAPFGVRLLVASTYLEAGMWDEALQEYRDLARLRPGDPEMIRRLAEALFLSGDTKQGAALFEEAARASSDPSSAWETVGAFYAERGFIQPAIDAFGRAIEAGGGEQGDALLRRGLLLALRGDWEASQEAIDAALEAPGDKERRYRLLLSTLEQVPRHALAGRYAGRALEGGFARDQALFLLAKAALSRGDEARGRALAREWAEGAGPAALLQLLLDQGAAPEALERLRDALGAHDPEALRLLFDERAVVQARSPLALALDQGGLDQLALLYRPLLEDPALAEALHRYLGPTLARREELDGATVSLKAASRQGPAETDLLLGRVQLSQGEPAEARATFTRALALAQSPEALQRDARAITLSWLQYGEPAQAEAWVRAAMTSPGRQSLLTPLLIELLLARGDRAGALAELRGGPLAPLFAPGEAPGDSARVADLLESTRALARHGYPAEAAALLREVAQARPDTPALLLALAEHDPREAERWARAFQEAAARNGQRPDEIQLQLAEAWVRARAWERARPLLLTLAAAHDRPTSLRALELSAATARAAQDPAFLQQALKADLQSREDRQEVLLDQALTLRRYGFFSEAADQYREARALSPRSAEHAYVNTALLAGRGDEALLARSQQYQRSAATLPQLTGFGQLLSRGPQPALAERWWSELGERWPALSELALEQARLAFLRGDDRAGVAALEGLLTASGGDPRALERALLVLVQHQRWEAATQLAARAPQDPQAQQRRLSALTPRSYLYLGAAAYLSKRRAEALQAFDTWTAEAPDRLQAHREVAEVLLTAPAHGVAEADALRDARTYTERALALHPQATAPRLALGRLRLRQGDARGALEDFDAYLQAGGYDHVQALQDMGRWLLEAGQRDPAQRLLLRLARHPGLEGTNGLVDALTAFSDAGQHAEGLAFLARHFPALASAPWLDPALLTRVADLQAQAGNLDRADALYEQGLTRYPDSTWVQNNYAWHLARHKRALDRAEALAWSALSHPDTGERLRGLYLDTLALIHLQQGEPQVALDEQLRALYMTQGHPEDAAALFAHLADLYKALGREQEATQALARARLHDPARSPFSPEF